jgi:hypothetical protein
MARGRSTAGLVGGIILIGLGALFLATRVFGEDIFQPLYPFLVLGVGSLFFLGMLWGGPEAAKLAIPGSIISMVGLILLAQNTFGRYETWSYAWTLIILSVGLGKLIAGWWGHDGQSYEQGTRIALLGAVLFLVFGGFFELVVGFSDFGTNGQLVWAGGLILLGFFLVVRSTGFLTRLR